MKTMMLCLVIAVCGLEAQAQQSFVSCRTTSQGQRFENTSRSSSFSRDYALSQCRGNRTTIDRECEVNLICSDETPARLVTCETTSQGQRFENTSRDSSFSRDYALIQCRGSRTTIDRECEVNLFCDDER